MQPTVLKMLRVRLPLHAHFGRVLKRRGHTEALSILRDSQDYTGPA
jgi:3,4-dihydroxy-2-butanone 4-phosphate synthase